MRNRKKAGGAAKHPPNSAPIPHIHCSSIEGEHLAVLLKSIRRAIESAKAENGGDSLPEKFWFKQQFSVGVNEVTRVLELMSPAAHSPHLEHNPKSHSVQLQAVLVASDCNPRWLTKHLPSLASSRKVPLFFVKGDTKGAGSLRLGKLVNLKTAIAVGVKAKGNAVNQCMEEHILLGSNGIDPGKEQLITTSPTE